MAQVTNALYVASIAGEAFYLPYEGIPMAPVTFSSGVPTNFPSLGASTPGIGYPVKGRRLPKGINTSAYALFMASPDTASSTTFVVTLVLALEPDKYNVDLVNTNVYMDANLGIITSGTSLCDDSAIVGTVTKAAVTMGTAVGVVTTTTFSVTSTSLAVNKPGLLRVNRYGTNALDTNQGAVILLWASITSS